MEPIKTHGAACEAVDSATAGTLFSPGVTENMLGGREAVDSATADTLFSPGVTENMLVGREAMDSAIAVTIFSPEVTENMLGGREALDSATAGTLFSPECYDDGIKLKSAEDSSYPGVISKIIEGCNAEDSKIVGTFHTPEMIASILGEYNDDGMKQEPMQYSPYPAKPKNKLVTRRDVYMRVRRSGKQTIDKQLYVLLDLLGDDYSKAILQSDRTLKRISSGLTFFMNRCNTTARAHGRLQKKRKDSWLDSPMYDPIEDFITRNEFLNREEEKYEKLFSTRLSSTPNHESNECQDESFAQNHFFSKKHYLIKLFKTLPQPAVKLIRLTENDIRAYKKHSLCSKSDSAGTKKNDNGLDVSKDFVENKLPLGSGISALKGVKVNISKDQPVLFKRPLKFVIVKKPQIGRTSTVKCMDENKPALASTSKCSSTFQLGKGNDLKRIEVYDAIYDKKLCTNDRFEILMKLLGDDYRSIIMQCDKIKQRIVNAIHYTLKRCAVLKRKNCNDPWLTGPMFDDIETFKRKHEVLNCNLQIRSSIVNNPSMPADSNSKPNPFSPLEALELMTKTGISSEGYNYLRNELRKKGYPGLPPYPHVIKAKRRKIGPNFAGPEG